MVMVTGYHWCLCVRCQDSVTRCHAGHNQLCRVSRAQPSTRLCSLHHWRWVTGPDDCITYCTALIELLAGVRPGACVCCTASHSQAAAILVFSQLVRAAAGRAPHQQQQDTAHSSTLAPAHRLLSPAPAPLAPAASPCRGSLVTPCLAQAALARPSTALPPAASTAPLLVAAHCSLPRLLAGARPRQPPAGGGDPLSPAPGCVHCAPPLP